ncbi:MAG: CCA tRNA nucleotidyltransferase [Pyrobaculum sp.]
MSLEEVLAEAFKLATPSPEEEAELRRVSQFVKELVASWLKDAGIDGEVNVYGSSARGTWLPGQRDVDVFVVLRDRGMGPEQVVDGLSKFLSERGVPWSLRYAQHPYLTLFIQGYEVDVVPCYSIAPGEKPLTAADRSPLHHKFLVERLSERQRLDVRVLKLFLKSIGVYGAEIKVEGFSGYLTELLVAYYGGFLEVLKAASKWRPYRTVISFTEAKPKFKAPLVVVDPVDPNRNVAAAVSLTSMSTFILASRRFLKNPSITYFKHGVGELVEPIHTVEVVFPYPGEAPDIVWGRYKKLGKSLYNWIRQCGFKVYRWGVESDEKTYVSLVYLVETYTLSQYVLHKGPPVYDDSVDVFVEKYLDEEVVGPFVQGYRVYVIRKRKFTNVSDCIKAKLGPGDHTIRLGEYRGELVRKNPWIT